jgi:hypothetical protein
MVAPTTPAADAAALGGPVPLAVVPEARRAQVGPNAPPPMRLMAAKALLPMEAAELAVVLAYLGGDEDEKLREAARKSAGEVPEALLGGPLADPKTHPLVLDYYGRLFYADNRYAQRLIVNAGTPDDTVRFMAERTKDAALLELIAQNQSRFLRYPAIVEALYFNPETRMSAVSRVIETAVRNGVRLTHIPGYKEIEESILGVVGAEEPEEKVEEREEEEAADAPGLDDEAFHAVLRTATSEEPEKAELQGPLAQSVWRMIAEMNVSQKVRLAMVGSEAARRLLVRDAKRVVAMSVLRSPKLTQKEVTNFAQQRVINEDVIREIARNREWTRYYPTMLALVCNPKCPPQHALTFVKMLNAKDLKSMSRDKDVPGFVSRTAKSLVEMREKKGR